MKTTSCESCGNAAGRAAGTAATAPTSTAQLQAFDEALRPDGGLAGPAQPRREPGGPGAADPGLHGHHAGLARAPARRRTRPDRDQPLPICSTSVFSPRQHLSSSRGRRGCGRRNRLRSTATSFRSPQDGRTSPAGPAAAATPVAAASRRRAPSHRRGSRLHRSRSGCATRTVSQSMSRQPEGRQPSCCPGLRLAHG